MVEAIVAAVIVGVFTGITQVLAKRAVEKKIDAMKKEAVNTRAELERNTALTKVGLDLLAPAIAQLPKTRAKRTKAAGLGETEVPVEE